MCLLNIYYTFFFVENSYTQLENQQQQQARIENKKKNNTPYTSRPGDYLVEKQIF